MFANDKSIKTLGQLFEECKKYILLQKEYMRLELVEKLTILSATCIMVVIGIILSMIALFYLSFCIAYIMAPHVGGLTVSFAIITVFILLLLAIVYIFRKKLIIQPVVKFMANLFMSPEETESDKE